MAKQKKQKMPGSATIARNKKATHDYFIEEDFEAGLALEDWEVKSLREGRVQLKESYVIAKGGELFLIGVHITPLTQASTHTRTDPTRTRKLLLHKKEISSLIGAAEQDGYTMVCTNLYWKRGKVKAKVAFAKGKKLHDKRHAIKEREWNRDKQRLLKETHRR